MTFEEKILADYKDAMKQRDSVKSTLLSTLRAEMMNDALKKNKPKLDDADALAVVKKSIKQHQDSIDQFTKGNRLDLVEKEKKELDILLGYLPPQLSEGDINAIIEDAMAATAAQGMKDMGKVMKEVTAKVAGAADGKVVSDLVRARLMKP